MYPYTYTVSLRVNHPKIDPAIITDNIRIKPLWSWMVGQPRSTPQGDKLSGIYEDTYWTAKLHVQKRRSSRKLSLEDFLSEQIERLKVSERFFKHIRRTGGQIAFFVGIFCDKNSGVEIPSTLLASMGKLGIDLLLDIYPENINN
jgi:hypothetical protein